MQQRILPLSKQDTSGLLQAPGFRIHGTPAAGMRRPLTTAGFAPIADTVDGPWGKATDNSPGVRLFAVGSLLPYLDRAAHERAPPALPSPLFGASYMSSFRKMMRGYGPVTASLSRSQATRARGSPSSRTSRRGRNGQDRPKGADRRPGRC